MFSLRERFASTLRALGAVQTVPGTAVRALVDAVVLTPNKGTHGLTSRFRGHAGGQRTKEEVAGTRRPLLSTIGATIAFWCSFGAHPQMGASVAARVASPNRRLS